MHPHHRDFDLIRQLGHELRGPITALRSAMEVLVRFGADPTVRNWVGEVMDRQTNQMNRLIDELVDASDQNEGRLRLFIQAVDLETIVNSAIETVRSAIARRSQKLEISLPPGPMTVVADPARLVQVLTNLLSNAAKFTEPNGRIELTAVREKHELILRVRDTGMGIATRDLPHIFERFWQSPRNDSSAGGGFGIGLTLVREIVQAHGGTVRASSAGAGRGSEFVVQVPQVLWAEPAKHELGRQRASTAIGLPRSMANGPRPKSETA
jgi:signal transduction histidine kinase